MWFLPHSARFLPIVCSWEQSYPLQNSNEGTKLILSFKRLEFSDAKFIIFLSLGGISNPLGSGCRAPKPLLGNKLSLVLGIRGVDKQQHGMTLNLKNAVSYLTIVFSQTMGRCLDFWRSGWPAKTNIYMNVCEKQLWIKNFKGYRKTNLRNLIHLRNFMISLKAKSHIFGHWRSKSRRTIEKEGIQHL